MKPSRLAPALLLATIAVASCGPPEDPGRRPVARIDDQVITRSELEFYFKSNLLEEAGGERLGEAEMNTVKSRLLDALIDERILLVEADARGISVADLEIAAYLTAVGSEGEEEDEEESEQRWREARRRIKIEKLQEAVALELPPIEDHEIGEFIEKDMGEGSEERRLELRSLMLDDLETANRVYREIRRRRITFAEAVVAHEAEPGQGVPIEVSWENLSQEVREALDGLKRGQVSRPVEMLGNIYLFKIETWLSAPARAGDEQTRRAIRELQARRRRQAFDELLEDARGKSRIKIHRRNLPFAYQPAAAA